MADGQTDISAATIASTITPCINRASHACIGLQIMWSASAENDEICKRIIKTGLHADMLKNLSWDTLSAATLDDDRSHAERTVVGLQISILHNVVRRTESARAALRKCQAVAVVQKFRGVKKDLYKVIVLLRTLH